MSSGSKKPRSASGVDALGEAASRQMRRLRWRVTGLIVLLVAAILTTFSALVVQLDERSREAALETQLLEKTNFAASRIGFVNSEPDLEPLGRLDDNVVVGLRQAYDEFYIVSQGQLWGEIPEISDEDLLAYVPAAVDALDDNDLAWILQIANESDRPSRAVMQQRVMDEVPEPITGEAYRQYIIEVFANRGIVLENPTEDLRRSRNSLLTRQAGIEAVDLVIDEGVEDPFDIDSDGRTLLARGVPVRGGGEIRGAVVAAVDPGPSRAAHRSFRNNLVMLSMFLTACSAGAAWLVAGRTIRPASRAMAQQERFLADAAHELRTPIAAIRATAETAGDDALPRVADLAGGAAQLTDDLLTLARMDADRLTLRREPVRLDLLVESVVDDNPAFNVKVVGDDSSLIVDADPNLLPRTITNLLNNATRHGGASAATPAVVTVSRGRVEVLDSGPGIAAEQNEAVFERFQSGAESPGHGLGLPLARWIARAHGGDLRVGPGPGGHFILEV